MQQGRKPPEINRKAAPQHEERSFARFRGLRMTAEGQIESE
jgi:hypothetical protein